MFPLLHFLLFRTSRFSCRGGWRFCNLGRLTLPSYPSAKRVGGEGENKIEVFGPFAFPRKKAKETPEMSLITHVPCGREEKVLSDFGGKNVGNSPKSAAIIYGPSFPFAK